MLFRLSLSFFIALLALITIEARETRPSGLQASLDTYCQNLGTDDSDVEGSDNADCNAMLYARKDGDFWRCFAGLTASKGAYCVDDKGAPAQCRGGLQTGNHYCTRTSQLLGLIAKGWNTACGTITVSGFKSVPAYNGVYFEIPGSIHRAQGWMDGKGHFLAQSPARYGNTYWFDDDFHDLDGTSSDGVWAYVDIKQTDYFTPDAASATAVGAREWDKRTKHWDPVSLSITHAPACGVGSSFNMHGSGKGTKEPVLVQPLTKASGDRLIISQLSVSLSDACGGYTWPTLSFSSAQCGGLRTRIMDNTAGHNRQSLANHKRKSWANLEFVCHKGAVSDWTFNIEEIDNSDCKYEFSFEVKGRVMQAVSGLQASLDTYCRNLGTDDGIKVGSDHPNCNPMLYARKDGHSWRCFAGLTGSLGPYCVGNKGGPAQCRAGDRSGGHYCTRTSQLLGQITEQWRNGCPQTSDHRCGPRFGGKFCSGVYDAQYCSEGSGWCGNTAAHRDAEKSTTYDAASIPAHCHTVTTTVKPQKPIQRCPGLGHGSRCGPLFQNQFCNRNNWPYCNEANGWCGNTAAHRDAQPSVAFDFGSLPKDCSTGVVVVHGRRHLRTA